jgi:hypothetical protein
VTAGPEPPAGAATPGQPAAGTAPDPGGLAGVVVTAVVLAGLAGLGVWTARRRRPG